MSPFTLVQASYLLSLLRGMNSTISVMDFYWRICLTFSKVFNSDFGKTVKIYLRSV